MALMYVKTAAFLVGEEGFNAKAPPIEPRSPTSRGDIGNQEQRGVIFLSPPDH